MLKVTLKHYSTACTGEIALGLSSRHQSQLYASYTPIIILFEQPFTFPIWKYVDAEAKWENVWRKTREFRVVTNSCLNQWHFLHARTVTWYKETHICKWTCGPCIPGTRNYLYRIVFFQLLASSAKASRSARWHVVMLFPQTLSVNWRAALSCLLTKTPRLRHLFSTIWCFISDLLFFSLIPYLFNNSPHHSSWIFPLMTRCNLLPILSISIYKSLWRLNWSCFQYCRSHVCLNLLKYLNNIYNKSRWPPCLQEIKCQYEVRSHNYD